MIKYEEHFGINIISTNLNNSTDVDFLTEDIVNDVEKFHTSIDEYKKTPLVKLDNLASKLGVKNIFVKDESYRYGLSAFKGLGGLYAIFRIVCDKLNLDYKSTTFKDLQNKDIKEKLKDIAKLFGQEEEAQKWLDAYYEKAEKLGEEIKKANGEDTTYLTVLASSGSFMVFSEGGIGTVLKDDMKLPQPANMPEQDSITLPTVTMEGLSEIDADHIIVIATESDKADLEASSVWSQIRAVKDGNVTILDASPYFSQAYNPIGRELILESVKDAVIK